MNDQRFFDLAMKVITRQATDAERADLDALLAQEPQSRAELERLEKDACVAKDVLPLITASPASAGEFPTYARERLQTAVRQTLRRPKFAATEPRRGWRWVMGLAIATAVVLLLALPVFRPRRGGDTMYTDRVPPPIEDSRPGVAHPVKAEISSTQRRERASERLLQAPANYTAAEAPKHVGETATVTDKVDGFHQSQQGGNILLTMGGKYPNQAFAAFIPSERAAAFSNVQQYEGRTVSVSGTIKLFNGKPEILVTLPSQISIK